VGLQLPARTGSTRRTRRLSLVSLSVLGLVLLTGCSGEAKRLGMPKPATEQGESILSLWQGAWIAALVTGGVVWGLIFYASWRFRRRSDDEVPIQTRYNLPLEIFYTIFPVIMVIVFFAHTVDVQNEVLDETGKPDNTITVTGQQWSWTFNYEHESADGSYVYESGTANYIPTLTIPVGETTQFNLVSADVIHDFGVPGFLMKMDVMPGQDNSFRVTPKEIGDYKGKCYELCGVSHSRMLFNVHIVSPDDYEAYLDDLAAEGNASENPLIGGKFVTDQAGLDSDDEEGSE
jgi:cytochrome c oxidase subunit II